jgi:NAD+ diphosphatase
MNPQDPLKAITFTGSQLDRLHSQRHNQSFVYQCIENPQSLWLLFYDLKPLIRTGPGKPLHEIVSCAVAWKLRSAVVPYIEEANTCHATIIVLGRIDTTYYCALELLQPYSSDGSEEHCELRPILPLLSPHDAAIVGYARSLMEWHSRNKFCGRCGSPTLIVDGGSKRQCVNGNSLPPPTTATPSKGPCGLKHYPRVDPVVIMLVISPDNQRCLLGRKHTYPEGVYSCLAGFVEPGESIEEAVCREVKEESNVDIDINKVVYVASQPWPFGGQIMIGCFAQATSTQIELTTELRELENVQWFGVSEVTEALKRSQATTSSKQLRIPPFTAIAHRLIVHWLNQKSLHLNKISNESGVCDTILSSKNK